MRWLALDPGETVGWATGWRTGSEFTLHNSGQVHHESFPKVLTEAADDARVEAVVMESFVLLDAKLRKGSVVTLKVIADLNHWVRSRGLPLYMQQASAAKGVITDKRLKTMHLWVPGKPHARDAVRHLVIATRRAASGSGTFKPVDAS